MRFAGHGSTLVGDNARQYCRAMTDTPSPESTGTPASGDSPSASPSGPADGVEQLFGVSADAPADVIIEPVAADAAGADAPAVARARRTLQRLALWLPLAGLVLSVVAIAVQVGTGGSIFGIDPVGEIVGFTLTFLGPVLLVVGLHMLIWRALVRPLSRMEPSNRIITIVGVGGLLSIASVLLVFILVFLGFIIVSSLLSASDLAL